MYDSWDGGNCHTCGDVLSTHPAFCIACETVQPFMLALSPFTYLGMAPAYPVQISDLEKTYFSLQRLLHPDKVSPESAETALRWSQSINKSYQDLKNPITLLRTVLHLKGLSLTATDQSPQTLETLFEWQNRAAEANDSTLLKGELSEYIKDLWRRVGDSWQQDDNDNLEQLYFLLHQLKILENKL